MQISQVPVAQVAQLLLSTVNIMTLVWETCTNLSLSCFKRVELVTHIKQALLKFYSKDWLETLTDLGVGRS